ncbi:hypothetical protein JXO59_16125 [candidate division KSB1 bacterium]|nr:hypothetical protein [candidate division KSB1 bacterium]
MASRKVAHKVRGMVDDLIVLESPEHFQAVAQVYRNWHDVTDTEALAALKGN